MTTKKLLLASGLVAGIFMLAIAGVSLFGLGQTVSAQSSLPSEFTLDVACDGRTCVINHRDPSLNTDDPVDPEDFHRGDTFIIEGVIFPGGTLPEGEDPRLPEDISGAIGKWVCQGVFNISADEAFNQGLSPHVYTTQYFMLDDGRTYVTEGPEGGGVFLRAITGGMGSASGAGGQSLEAEIGVNGTFFPNIHFKFSVESTSEQLARIESAAAANGDMATAVKGLLDRVARSLSLVP